MLYAPTIRRLPLATLGLALTLAWPLNPGEAQTLTAGTMSALPALGGAEGMDLVEERRLGDRIARDLYRDPDFLDDPVLGDYLQSLWRPLLAAARARGDVPEDLAERLAWELLISRDRRVNAFALPGGYLGVQLGLVAATESAEELASVLAHELSHVSQRHIARLIGRQQQQTPWILGALILGALAARANADVANAAVVGSQAVAAQTQLNFSRDMEREADRVGFGVLTAAGFDGQGFVSMFDKLQQASRLNDDGAFPYLRSHPLTTERMADMRARVPLEAGPPVAAGGPAGTRALHALMAARARVLAETASDRLQTLMRQGEAPGATGAEQYAGALAAHRLGRHAQALALAGALHARLKAHGPADAARSGEALWLELMLAPGATALRDPRSLADLRDRALAAPGRTARLLGAQAALASGDAARASSRLQTWVVEHPRDALAWQTLAVAYQAQGLGLRALRAEAEARAAQRDEQGAVDRLRAAQALPRSVLDQDPFEAAIVDSRRRALEAQLRELATETR